jgi:hypothetical protein
MTIAITCEESYMTPRRPNNRDLSQAAIQALDKWPYETPMVGNITGGNLFAQTSVAEEGV